MPTRETAGRRTPAGHVAIGRLGGRALRRTRARPRSTRSIGRSAERNRALCEGPGGGDAVILGMFPDRLLPRSRTTVAGADPLDSRMVPIGCQYRQRSAVEAGRFTR